MSDIVERLNANVSNVYPGHHHSRLCAEAAAELTRLRDELAKAKEALEPFALEDGDYQGRDDNEAIGVFIRLADFRRARAALKEQQP